MRPIERTLLPLLLVTMGALAAIAPLPGAAEQLRFVWFADSRSATPTVSNPPLIDLMNAPVLTAIRDEILALSPRPQFAVFGGDMAYRGKYKGDWTFPTWNNLVLQPLKDAGINVYVTVGNHELYQHPGAGFYLENQVKFQQTYLDNPANGPAGYERLAYSFTSPGGEIFFAALDPYYLDGDQPNVDEEDNGKIDTPQLAWFESQAQQSTAKHKFLFIHTPYYSVTSTSPADGSYTRLWQILDDNRFDAYFCGHAHLFSRKTIDGRVPPNPNFLPPITWNHDIVQLLNGAAGAGPDSGATIIRDASWHVSNAPQTYYFSVVDIDGPAMRIASYRGNTGRYELFDVYPDPAAQVPTLSEWAMAACALLLLASAGVALRRRAAARSGPPGR